MTVSVAGHTVTPALVVVAVGMIAATITVATITGVSGWLVALGLIGPDLAFLAGLGQRPTERGRMPSRVIPVYNALHHPAGPFVLLGVSLAFVGVPALTLSIAVTAMAWLSHIVWDRSVGYGLRDRSGAMKAPQQNRSRSARATAASPT